MFAFLIGNAGEGDQDGCKEKRVGYEGRDSDEGGEESYLAFTSERKGFGTTGTVHDPLNT